MAVMMDIKGTSQATFQIQKGGAKLTNNAQVLEIYQANGTSFASVLAASLRLDNNNSLKFRNAANSADESVLLMDANDDLLVMAVNNLRVVAQAGNVQLDASTELIDIKSNGNAAAPSVRFFEADNNNYIALKAPDSVTADLTYVLPVSPVNGYILSTDNAGVMSWIAPATAPTGTVTRDTTSIAFGASSPVAMFTLPANAVVESVQVIVDTAFDGTPTLEVGISGNTDKYMAQADVDLTSGAGDRWESNPNEIPVGGTEAIIATYAAGGATVGAGRILVSYSVPN